MRLFIVDDETIIRKGIISILRQNCAFVEVAGEAANGKAALEAIGAACPDVVVTDIKMPVMDGVELTKRLHTLYPHIRVIVLSGYDDYCFVRLSMKYGAFDYLLKPIDKHEFLSVVRLLQQSELIEQGKIEPNANSLINSAKTYIRKHYANKLTMVQAADYVHLNPSYFSKLFRSKTGVTFTDYLTNVRITQAKQLLLNTDDRICDICLNVGFSDNVTFNRAFRRVVGVSPTDYRNQFSFAEHDGDAD